MSGCAYTSESAINICNCYCHSKPVSMPNCCPCIKQTSTTTISSPIETLVRLDKIEKQLECYTAYVDGFEKGLDERLLKIEQRLEKNSEYFYNFHKKRYFGTEEKINSLNSKTTHNLEWLDKLDGRLLKVESQLDANASPHFDHDDYRELKKQINALSEMYEDLSLKWAASYDSKSAVWILKERMEILENSFNKLEQLVYDEKEKFRENKKPYKCPICEGYGFNKNVNLMSNDQPVNVDCFSCQGKGIVWG
jgi:hypothetical protein